MDFERLYNNFFIISNLFAERQIGNKKEFFERKEPRPADALLLLTESTAIYGQERKDPLYIPRGALVYIPKGSIYTVENYSVDKNDKVKVMIFDFTLHPCDVSKSDEGELMVDANSNDYLSLGTNEITVVDLRPKIYERLFSSLIDNYEAYLNNQASMVSVYSAAYSIFEALIKNQHSQATNNSAASIVDVAMKYLSSTGPNEKSIQEIAKLCCVSISGLEKSFKSITGMSPIEYRLDCKILQAKTMIADKKLSIAEIANKLGFCDSGYLCRTFKKKIGMTPKQYQNTVK